MTTAARADGAGETERDREMGADKSGEGRGHSAHHSLAGIRDKICCSLFPELAQFLAFYLNHVTLQSQEKGKDG